MSAETVCSACRQPKSTRTNGLLCGLCYEILCKDCAIFMPDDAFSFLPDIPEDLRHPIYCPRCHDQKVQPALDEYNAKLNRAKEVLIFDKKVKHVPTTKIDRYKISVTDCPDKQEMMMRLAFQAVEQSFNAIIKAEMSSKKVNLGGYQTSAWSGSGFPANVNKEELVEAEIWDRNNRK